MDKKIAIIAILFLLVVAKIMMVARGRTIIGEYDETNEETQIKSLP
ncbi:MAG: hypothetical protein PUJ11_00850 [Eubacteriaceae bacterium]|nr:hypothetical protein [Eubacteriaceae bacterium]